MYGTSSPPPSASGAKILILIGLVLQAIEAAVLVGASLFFLIVPFAAFFLIPLAGIAILWVILVYLFSYRRAADGDYEGARTPTLVFAILSLLTLAIIPGILYIVGYAQLGSAISEQRTPMNPYGAPPAWSTPPPLAPAGGAPPGSRFCSHCGRPNPVSSQFCAGCGAGMS